MYLAHDRCFHLYYVFGIWSMACCKTAFNITIHSMKLITYILYIEPYHVHIAYKIYAFIGVWVGYDQCCVCWWSDDRLHSPMGRLSTEFVFCTMEPVYSDHNFFVVPQDRWSLLTGVICKLSFTIYISYDLWYHPCCVYKLWSMPCLPMSGAETASGHGQTWHSTYAC